MKSVHHVLLGCVAILIFSASGQRAIAQQYQDNSFTKQQFNSQSQNAGAAMTDTQTQQQPNQEMSGGQASTNVGSAGATPENQRQEAKQQSLQYEKDIDDTAKPVNSQSTASSQAAGESLASAFRHDEFRAPQQVVMNQRTPRETSAGLGAGEKASYGSDFFDGGTLGGAATGGSGSSQHSGTGNGGCDGNGAGACNGATGAGCSNMANDSQPGQGQQGQKSCGNDKQGSRGGSAGDDSKQCMHSCFETAQDYLINVANEGAGSACSSRQVSKTYNNAVWMVQKMYKECYIPMAILFLLPGAIITNTKTLVNFGILGGKDDDVVSPFTGIMRSIIAIFLIPATQLLTSYVIDTANALEDCAKKYVSLPLIFLWAEEQIQTFGPEQQGKLLKNLPNVPMAPYLGKFAGMPGKGAILEQVGGLQEALTELCNECLHMLTIGLNVISAFQIVMICYLFLMGPLAASFFTWPSVGRDLFRKAFSTWVDGVVVLSLWKFWWNVVLLTMTVRLQAEAVNPFDVWEVYYLIAFISIMMVVPFNPFDFRPGEIVTHVLGKAEGVAAKVAQSGKGGGSKGGGKSGGCGGGGKPSEASGG